MMNPFLIRDKVTTAILAVGLVTILWALFVYGDKSFPERISLLGTLTFVAGMCFAVAVLIESNQIRKPMKWLGISLAIAVLGFVLGTATYTGPPVMF